MTETVTPVPTAADDAAVRLAMRQALQGTGLRDILRAAGARVQTQIDAERAAGVPAPVPVRTLPPVPARTLLPVTDADDCTRAPAVGQLPGRTADQARRALDLTDAEADAANAGEPDPLGDAERCDTCRGFGLVRKAGKRAGERYRSLAGAQAAQVNGNAVDCPTCDGLGLVGLA